MERYLNQSGICSPKYRYTAPPQQQELSIDELFATLQKKLKSADLKSLAFQTSVERYTNQTWDILELLHGNHKVILVDRNVKGLLDELTMENFDSISDQMITWANGAESEQDGRTLNRVIHLILEKVTDDVVSSELYARLCRNMMERISPRASDHGLKDDKGRPIAGGRLFRKYLLSSCQAAFEHGLVGKEATNTVPSEDRVYMNEGNKEFNEDYVRYFSEDNAAMPKVKGSAFTVIKFIGELFKLDMVTERIMHTCIQKLLVNVDNPREEEIEGVCTLLTNVGSLLDTSKARAHMDVYFSRIKKLTKSHSITSPTKDMLIDLVELRRRKWRPYAKGAAPTTVPHEAVAEEKSFQGIDPYQHEMSRSWSGDGRDGDYDESRLDVGPDDWAFGGAITSPSSSTPQPPHKAGDLSNDVVSTWQNLFQMKKAPDISVQQHASDIRDIADRLTRFGDKPSDNLLVAVLLQSLPDSYSDFVGSLALERSASNNLHNDFDSIVQRCIDEEARQVDS